MLYSFFSFLFEQKKMYEYEVRRDRYVLQFTEREPHRKIYMHEMLRNFGNMCEYVGRRTHIFNHIHSIYGFECVQMWRVLVCNVLTTRSYSSLMSQFKFTALHIYEMKFYGRSILLSISHKICPEVHKCIANTFNQLHDYMTLVTNCYLFFFFVYFFTF